MSVVRHHRAQENEQTSSRTVKSNFGKENAVKSAKLSKSTPSHQLSHSARKALGDVSNKRPPKLQLSEKLQRNTEEFCPTPSMKPPVARFTFKTEEKKSDFDEFPFKNDEVETMPQHVEAEDDYEDIWPKSERVTVEEILKWQPFIRPLAEPLQEDFKHTLLVNAVLPPVIEFEKEIADIADNSPLLEFDEDDFFI